MMPAKLSTRSARRGKTLLPLLLILLLATAGGSLFRSSADITVANQPAAGGRAITPAGSLVLDQTTRQPAVGALPVNFVRSTDQTGPGGRGRYLVAVNSGYGLQFNSTDTHPLQSLAVIDLNARGGASVVQNIYFPAPQSANIGAVFDPRPARDGSFTLYVSGGFENKIWMFLLRPGAAVPLTPAPSGPDAPVEAPFIDVSGFAPAAPTPRYNNNRAPVYPSGLAISPDGTALFVANNLGDSLGIIRDVRGARLLERVELRGQKGTGAGDSLVYPYGVAVVPSSAQGGVMKAYVSCWNDASVAVIDIDTNADAQARRVSYIPVARHPTMMTLNGAASRLYVVNSNADSVSVIDSRTDREIERIDVRLAERVPAGNSPEGLALDETGATLYVANAHSNSVAVVALSAAARGDEASPGALGRSAEGEPAPRLSERDEARRSRVRGFIPTGQYPSALAFAGGTLFVGNGKGTGMENSSVVVNNSGRTPNLPNDRFPVGTGRAGGEGGQYSVSIVAGNISQLPAPDERALARYTQSVMRNNNLLGAQNKRLFPGKSPIRHIIYVIKENRTYDQVFGDMERAGNGERADGDPMLAIFGAGDVARSPNGAPQNVTPNHRALALRFGLFDRFFANSEASPDGHNWSTAAFSSDYTDKAYRWNYGGRGRTYDFEGFNRLPNIQPSTSAPALFPERVEAQTIADYMRRFIPYLHGRRDVAEPESLYLWDAAARAGLTYRNYGEFVATLSASDVAAINANRAKSYPDMTQTVSAVPTKRSLEGHHSTTFRNFDMKTPDALSVDSYRAAKEALVNAGREANASASAPPDPLISRANTDERLRGVSRLGDWLEEFRGFVVGREAGRGDAMPNFSILRLPNDHTTGLAAGAPSPQFYVAENDYAVGRLVEAVSHSPYWRDTAIFIVEDDAQDGPDHVDSHRTVALVISAYNRPGALVHEFHNTVSMIRTMELLLGMEPMNQLDATASPIDLFRAEADLRPYTALLPDVALNNLTVTSARDRATRYWMQRTAEQNLAHADMADPEVLNQIIWFSVRGAGVPMPEVARLPAFDAMREGIREEEEEDEATEEHEREGETSTPRHRRRAARRAVEDD